MNKAGGRFTATLKSTSATTKSPTGSFEAILSVPVKDRDGEVVDAGAFNPLPEHITIDVDHAMTVEKTVASGRPFYDGELLKFAGTYASHPLAQMVRSLVDEGHIKTMSVTYLSPVYEIDEKDGLPHLRSAELINAGIVGIPANREALITASKMLADLDKIPDHVDTHVTSNLAAGTGSGLELKAVADFLGQPMTLLERLRSGRGKSVVGSYEERGERLREAIKAAYPQTDWVWVRATFDDAVVFDLEMSGLSSTFQASYSVGDDGIILEEAREVGLAEVVVAPLKSVTSTTPATKTAADEAAVGSPAEVDVARAKAAVSAAVGAALALPS